MTLGGHKKPTGAFLLREDRDGKQDNKSRSARHEARLAVDMRAKVQPNSGALPFASQKGDMQDADFVYQAKLTQGKSYSITAGVLAEIHRQAAQVGKNPALVITLDGLPQQLPKDWVVIPMHVWREIMGL